MPATLPDVPTYDAFMLPIVERLKVHGRSMTNAEMEADVAQHMGLSDEMRSLRHGKWNQLVVEQRLGFARSFLKLGGALINSGRGVWSLTPLGATMSPDDIAAISRAVQRDYAARRQAETVEVEEAKATNSSALPRPGATTADPPPDPGLLIELDGGSSPISWREQLLAVLLQMDPAAFERLCQRLLRESGFTKVEVTGRSGDGGIDGVGVLRVNLLSFHVLFQSKRWKGSLGASVVRDFRGAMVGRSDKGLIITTGTFTPDARREATRDGAPAIDLVDGEALCELLKELGLGVNVRMVPEVMVDAAALAEI